MFYCVVFSHLRSGGGSGSLRGSCGSCGVTLKKERGKKKKKKKVWMGGGMDATKKSDRWKSQHTHGT